MCVILGSNGPNFNSSKYLLTILLSFCAFFPFKNHFSVKYSRKKYAYVFNMCFDFQKEKNIPSFFHTNQYNLSRSVVGKKSRVTLVESFGRSAYSIFLHCTSIKLFFISSTKHKFMLLFFLYDDMI